MLQVVHLDTVFCVVFMLDYMYRRSSTSTDQHKLLIELLICDLKSITEQDYI